MSDRAHLYTLLGPISPGARNFLGCFIRGSGQAAAPVVMVWVPAAIADNAEALKELALDTEAAEKLDHPNIIKVYGLEKLEQGWARIVEYADAEPLRAIIEAERTREGRISPALAASIVADACSGVHFAHETGEKGPRRHPILHGGLRPEVLQVTHDGRTKVTGYGAAAKTQVAQMVRTLLALEAGLQADAADALAAALCHSQTRRLGGLQGALLAAGAAALTA